MNVEVNATASENWEIFLSTIHEGLGSTGRRIVVFLSDRREDRYDFANAILMRRMRERLVDALQVAPMIRGTLWFGNKFFMTMNEQQQQSFFGSIFNLPVWRIMVGEATDNNKESPAITISTPALLETLPQLQTSVLRFIVNNFALSCQSDVQALSNIIGSKRATLRYLGLENIECPVDDCNEEGSDKSDGFLDPLFYAASGLDAFSVRAKKRDAHWTLVSPTALRALFVEGKQFRELYLNDLGLTDSHVLVIVDGLSTSGIYLDYLNLTHNPGITTQGYGALLNLSNRANVIDRVSLCNLNEPCVDERLGRSSSTSCLK